MDSKPYETPEVGLLLSIAFLRLMQAKSFFPGPPPDAVWGMAPDLLASLAVSTAVNCVEAAISHWREAMRRAGRDDLVKLLDDGLRAARPVEPKPS